jgi:serine/threonine-protein kinase HipA
VTLALAMNRDEDRRSRFEVCEKAAESYLLTRAEARDIIDRLVTAVEDGWEAATAQLGLDDIDSKRNYGDAVKNSSIFYRD